MTNNDDVVCESGSVSDTGDVIAYYDKSAWNVMLGLTKKPTIPLFNEISYKEFFENYLLKNLPCMFSEQVTKDWMSRQLWTSGCDGEVINFAHLNRIYGNAKVSVDNCDDVDYKHGYGTSDCREMTLQEFTNYWDEYIQTGHDKNLNCLYLKDWHIVRSCKMEKISEIPYETPKYFKSDWLNETCEQKDSDDYKFCYMGPKGSFTSFHSDVYGSYSWSANVTGVKKWHLYPPGKELRFKTGNSLVYDWDNPGTPGEDFVEVIQNEGECIFVPSGWYHVVWNLTDVISINHNWFNGANICYIWKTLQKALADVEREISNLREIPDYFEKCQLILRANHGMNYADFFEILTTVMENRKLRNGFNNHPDPAYSNFDINAINHCILEHCLEDPLVEAHYSAQVSTLSNA